MPQGKRKRSGDRVYAVFPGEDFHSGKKPSTDSSIDFSTLSKAWERCGEGFSGCQSQKARRPTERKTLTVHSLAQSFLSDDESSVSERLKDPADIVWSSSDSELSNDGTKQLLFQHGSVGCIKAGDAPQNTEQHNVGNIEFDKKSTTPEAAESEIQISDSESSSSIITSDQLLTDSEPTKALEIAEYSSDDLEEGVHSVMNYSLGDEGKACPPMEKSASDWVRTAQVLLQTPEKTPAKACKTPDDSAKKRKRFLGGGLAERLNRLQNRERSAISFWRHQCDSDCRMPLGDKSGTLVLKIIEVHEECSFQVAVCQNLTGLRNTGNVSTSACNPAEMLKVLFTKQTASQLKGCPHDIIHIHPPWVKLTLRAENTAVILNTHYSLKITENQNGGKNKKIISSLLPEKKKVVPLSLVFQINDTESPGEVQHKMCITQGKPSTSSSSVNDSLLDVVETQGAAGWRGSCMHVVVQRVYGLPTRDNSAYCLMGSVKHIAATAGSSQKLDVRLCLLVQDAYGMFSEVHVQSTDCTAADIELYRRRWEGTTCCLSGMKILQRTTRGRAPGLFSLIDSLWPPLVPIKIHGQSQDQGQVQTNLPAPSFCYIFSIHHYEADDSIRVEEHSLKLYLPPVVYNLEDIVQVVGLNQRCSFWVTVIYVRPEVDDQIPPQKDMWMFVTDVTLQETSECSPRVLPVCVSPSCVLDSRVLQALHSQLPCAVSFKDAVKENGKIICVERTVLSLQKPPSSCAPGVNELTGPVVLDGLDSTTEANSLCSVKGIIVGVNERTAFSWPVCNLCGSSKLQLSTEHGGFNKYFCSSCSRDVNSPTTKMQLEVFLQCDLLPGCNVTLKLLQESISFLLSFCDSEDGRYDVNGIIGREVGPLNCYVQSSSVCPESSVALEEICLLNAGS